MPIGLFQSIEKDKNSKCKTKLDYTMDWIEYMIGNLLKRRNFNRNLKEKWHVNI